MPPSCENLRQRLALEAGTPRPWPGWAEGHVADCPACAAWSARLLAATQAVAKLSRRGVPAQLAARVTFACDPGALGLRAAAHLNGLKRLTAPAALDGRVVAALHGGHREERAIVELTRLEQLEAPDVLERLVRERVPRPVPLQRPAPEVLEERVASDLIQLPRARVRRAASRMGRRASSEALARRIRGRISSGRSQRVLLLAGVTGAMALLLLAWSLVPVIGPLAAPRPALPGLVVLPAGPDQDLSGLAAGMVDGVTGGLWSLREARPGAAAAARDGGLEGGAGVGLERSPAARDQDRQPLGVRPSGQRIGRAPAAPHAPAPPHGAPGQHGGPGSSFITKLASSGQTPFRAQRRVELFLHPGGDVPDVSYREEVIVGPGGEFAVEPLQVLNLPLNSVGEQLFLTLQKAREGFVHRHRDFRVRDEALFLDNYSVIEQDDQALVAGRPAIELEVRRIEEARRWYRVWVDQETGLVLAYDEHRLDGALLARVELEIFEVEPALDGVPLTSGASIWQPLDPQEPAAWPFELSLPVAVPPGFQLIGFATTQFEDQDWIRLVYGDGVEQVFLLLGPPSSTPTLNPVGSGGLPASQPTHHSSIGPARMWYFEIGSWAVVQGQVGGRQAASLGKVHQLELGLLLQSALEG